MKWKYFLLLLPIVLVAGCTENQVVGNGLITTISPDSSMVFSSGTVRINVDLDNQNPRPITDVNAAIFDPGLLKAMGGDTIDLYNLANTKTCGKHIDEMLPNQFQSFACIFQAPSKIELPQNSLENDINAKVEYKTDFSAVQLIELMTDQEYLRRTATNTFQQKSKSYSYHDRNVEIDVDFSDNLPIVKRSGDQKDYFVYITIKNIGNGFIKEITRNDFNIVQAKAGGVNIEDIVSCPFRDQQNWKLEPLGKEFPRIACQLNLPEGLNVIENYGMLITLNYNYETRDKATITVVR
ncbi:MAG: hypothetical protein NT120_01800 [Candidatus Aenigmarchaeota archaeon]|nr:hypothetical protein [Candidatus Aenigmarchaeota archaeon]